LAAAPAVWLAALRAFCWRPRACPPFFAAWRRSAVEPEPDERLLAVERRDEVVELLREEEALRPEGEPLCERVEDPELRLEEEERPLADRAREPEPVPLGEREPLPEPEPVLLAERELVPELEPRELEPREPPPDECPSEPLEELEESPLPP